MVVVVHGWRALQPFFVRRRPPLPLGPDPHDPARARSRPKGRMPGCRPTTRRASISCSPAWPRSPGSTCRARRRCSGSLWLPVIPLGAYLLARRLTGRADVALVAAALTAFGGGLDLSNDRLWVNSMFLVGQVAYPIYPRDLVFGILPFAILAFLRATDGGRRWARLGAGRRRAARRVRADPGPAPAPDPVRPRDAGRGPRLARSEPLDGRRSASLVDDRARRGAARRAVARLAGRDDRPQRRRSRSIRRRTCCRSGSGSGTTRSSSG